MQGKYKSIKGGVLSALKNEIEIMKDLNHPNIVKLYSTSHDSRYIYMYLEYVPTGDLLKI